MVIIIIISFVTCQEDGEQIKIYGELYFHIVNDFSLKNTNSPACDLDNADKIILTILHSDGTETKYVSSELKLFKMNERFQNVPVIVLTAKETKDDVVKAINLGANDYIVKPFETVELFNKIEKLLNSKIQKMQ